MEKLNKLKEIDNEIKKLHDLQDREEISLSDAIGALREKKKALLETLSRWDRVYFARHPERPGSLDFIRNVFDSWEELSGDRTYRDDPSLISGLASIGKNNFAVVGLEKGKDLDSRMMRNFGMAHPEGYRKASRIYRMASAFGLPIITFVDTPGAYPGIEAEERGQATAIAENLKLAFSVSTPIIVFVIGEGGSGGALAIGIGDRVYMLENSVYSVISPEGCASILWRDPAYASEAAENLRICSEDLLRLEVIDGIISEPRGGMHEDPSDVYKNVRKTILKDVKRLKNDKDIIIKRMEKYQKMGFFKE